MAKSTKQKMILREVRIQELMADGCGRDQIVEAIAKEFDVSPRGAQDQYYRVISEVAKGVEENRAELRTHLMARNDKIYRKSMSEGKYKTALDANVAQAKLAGINETGEKETRTPEVITIKTTDMSKHVSLVGKKAENE